MSKKTNEKFHLENLFKFLVEKPFEIEDRESPDFIVTLMSGKKVGVEVVEYHSASKTTNGKPRRAFEETIDVLYKDLHQQAEKYPELKGIYGFFSFKEKRVAPRSKHKVFIDQAIQLTREKVHDLSQTNLLKVKPDGGKYPLLDQYLKELHLHKTEVSFHPQWGGVDASSVGLDEDELINAIQEKINKAGKYQVQGINELWLLIVSGHRLSQAMPPPEHLQYKLKSFGRLNNLLRKSGYNKVYLSQRMFAVIHEWPGWKKITEKNGSDGKGP